MRSLDKLAVSQRIVIVVALGLILAAVGSYLRALYGGPSFGWYAYAPLTTSISVPGGMPTWLSLLEWLGLILIWALASVRILRSAAAGNAVTADPDAGTLQSR